MNKVFGYSKKSGKDWFATDAYSDKEIESIADPEGGSEMSLPTAIPSPFARIDLVKTAFRNIADTPNLKAYNKGETVVAGKEDEKLVSDALDVAELLFNIDSIRDKVKIIVWDRSVEMEKLRKGSVMHRRLGETLALYLQQDKQSYNFDLLQRLYLIEYNHKIIGCTSPVTMFFATASDLSHARIKLTRNNMTFGEQGVPLYERDAAFQEYLYRLFGSNDLLKKRLTIFNEYLEKNLKILDEVNHELYRRIKGLQATRPLKEDYDELNTGTIGSNIEVLGVTLYKRKKASIINSITGSDFVIRATKPRSGLAPLVLQNGLNKPFRYANDLWDNNTAVPYEDAEPNLEKRWLPGIHIQYPYLTVSDFLEPYLIRLVYPVNNEKFFDGNLVVESGNSDKGYLLPLKKMFFEYFTAQDLLSALPDKPRIEMVQGAAGSVRVTLRLPVARTGEYIYFQRTYYQSPENQLAKPDPRQNKGVIAEHQFGVTVFPFIKISDPEIKPYYRVQVVDRDITGLFKTSSYELDFYADNAKDPVAIRAKKTRSKKNTQALEPGSQYYVLDDEFDFIHVKNVAGSGASGVIIPMWQPVQQGNEVFSFSVDFGTTNTHIEYKTGNGSPRPFDITPEDMQIATLFHPDKTSEDFSGSGANAIRELITHEFVPLQIGNNAPFRFPHRTVIAESFTLNIETETFSLADFNIPFMYERFAERDKILSNLKWAKKEKGNEKRVRAYFEKIIMLLRNKVLLNRGSLSQTRLVWFYPSSMKPARKSSLENTWTELFNRYFSPVNKPVGITESLPPFYYYKGSARLQGGAYKPVVSIDIGGGTTDVVVFKANKPLLLSSFKFAANSIFGDGFTEFGAASSNGIIQKYLPYFQNLLETNNFHDLKEVLRLIREKNRTEDINAFFFSLENNLAIKDRTLFSYNSILARDEDLKIIFLYFYTAIIYHIAGVMKHKGVEMPKHIVFSGTGSKILAIITTDEKLLAKLSRFIFEEVYGMAYDSDGLTIETERHMPKEVTCKGGLMVQPEDLAIDVQEIRANITFGKSTSFERLTYDMLDDGVLADIEAYVAAFNEFFLQLNEQFSFSDHFGISGTSWSIFKTEFNKHLRDYLEEGLEFNRKMDEQSSDEKIVEETLFFYPLTGIINNLSSHLSKLTPVNF